MTCNFVLVKYYIFTPLVFVPDCEWKAQMGNACAASFDWTCSGICRSVERIKGVHERCGEGEDVVWNVTL